MKFRGHETFYIRKGWLNKGLSVLEDDEYRTFTTKSINAADHLGIGVNMVKSLRYWLTTLNLVEEKFIDGNKCLIPTTMGSIIWKNDKYFQEEGTLWLLHYFLVSNEEFATSWYWFFNEFNMNEFDRDQFVGTLQRYVIVNSETKVAKRSLEDDFSCLINTYFKKPFKKKDHPETNLVSPLTELRLIQDTESNSYIKVRKESDDIEIDIALFVMLDQYYKTEQSIEQNEISISTLLNAPNNIGKVFNLDWRSLNKVLDILQKRKAIKVIRTAGLDIVKIATDLKPIEILEKYYSSINHE